MGAFDKTLVPGEGASSSVFDQPVKFAGASKVAAADAEAAAGPSPTKAEFDAVVKLANELKKTLNSMLSWEVPNGG